MNPVLLIKQDRVHPLTGQIKGKSEKCFSEAP